MDIHKFIASHKTSFLHGFYQLVRIIIPFLACMVLTYCSKSVYLYHLEGHHVDTYMVFLRMMQCAAFVAPATVYLLQSVGYGPVLCVGSSFTILGITTPSLFGETRKQEIAFAVFYGAGVSIMFQATATAASSIFRKNIICSVVVLGLCATVMALTQQLFELATVKFSQQKIFVMLLITPIMCIFPALADVIRIKLEKNKKDVPVSSFYEKTNEVPDNLEWKEVKKVPLALGDVNPCTTDSSSEITSAVNAVYLMNKCDWKWSMCAILWWSIGVHLSFLSTSINELSIDIKMLTCMSLLSLLTFGLKIFVTERKKDHISDHESDNSSGYFMLGLLGIGGLLMRCYPLFTYMQCYGLLFTMGFYHQLKPYNGPPLEPNNYRDIGWMINHICVKLVITFCLMAIGYQIANTLYFLIVAQIVSSILFSGDSLSVLSAAMVLLSLRYSIKKKWTAQGSTVESQCNGQA